MLLGPIRNRHGFGDFGSEAHENQPDVQVRPLVFDQEHFVTVCLCEPAFGLNHDGLLGQNPVWRIAPLHRHLVRDMHRLIPGATLRQTGIDVSFKLAAEASVTPQAGPAFVLLCAVAAAGDATHS